MSNYTPAKKAEKRNSTPLTNNNDFIALIQKFEAQIKLALPRHLTPSRMTRIIITEVRKTPALASCDRASFFGAVITCAQLGLEPGSGLGQVYLIPFKNYKTQQDEVQVIIGYQGMIDLAERDGRVTVEAQIVYERDEFDFTLGTEGTIKHKPYLGSESPGEIIASYAVARYKDGRVKFRVLSRHEIDKARGSSKTSNFGPWKDNYAEMARKTAVRRLFKMLPKSPEIARAVEIEEKLEIGESQDLGDVYGEFREENKLEEIAEKSESFASKEKNETSL